MVYAILCSNLLGGIGKNNKLLFNIKEDMDFFKEKTMGNIVVMGYNTFLSLGSKPLLNRHNIVLTEKNIEGVETSNCLTSVIKKYSKENIFIIGGASIYNQVLEQNLADEVLLTLVSDSTKEADAIVNLGLIFKNFTKAEKIKNITTEDSLTVSIWKFSKK